VSPLWNNVTYIQNSLPKFQIDVCWLVLIQFDRRIDVWNWCLILRKMSDQWCPGLDLIILIRSSISLKQILTIIIIKSTSSSVNVPTTGAQALLMDPTKRTGHSPPHGLSADSWVLTTANAAGTNGLMCLPKQRARDDTFFITQPTSTLCERCLTSTIVRRAHWPRGHRAPKSTPKRKAKINRLNFDKEIDMNLKIIYGYFYKCQ
jgi:hypothetical protein